MEWVLEARMPCGTSGGISEEPLAFAATCAQEAVATRPPLKLAALSGVVLNPTQLLIIVISLWIFYVHFAAS